MQINESQYQQIMEALQERNRLKMLEARIMLANLKAEQCNVRSFYRKAEESKILWQEWTNRGAN